MMLRRSHRLLLSGNKFRVNAARDKVLLTLSDLACCKLDVLVLYYLACKPRSFASLTLSCLSRGLSKHKNPFRVSERAKRKDFFKGKASEKEIERKNKT